jgi:hypothetical protein
VTPSGRSELRCAPEPGGRHAAQRSRGPVALTVHTGLVVITGTEDRQHAYVALSRAADVHLAYVFTTSPKRAHPVPGRRPAPELAPYDQIYPERTGVRAPDPRPAPPRTALAVLAGVLDRDGQQRSATQTRYQALADADHLAPWPPTPNYVTVRRCPWRSRPAPVPLP